MTGNRSGLRLALATLLVSDYDEAVSWFVGRLGFELTEDTPLGGGKRWVTVRPGSQGGAGLLLARAEGALQRAGIGGQAGGRVAFFLQTDDFSADHRRLSDNGVRFLESPRLEAYGTVAVFEDLYANRWDLVEYVRPASGEHAI